MTNEDKKSFGLFPNNETYRLKWLENYRYLKNANKLASENGGWLLDYGRYLPEFKFSTFNKIK